MEKQLASETDRDIDDRTEHANLALKYEQEEREHEKRKLDFERQLADTKVGHVASQTATQVGLSSPSPKTSPAVADVAASKIRKAKRYIEDTGEWMKNGVKRAFSGPVARTSPFSNAAADLADMKSEVRDRIDSAAGVIIDGSKEAKHAMRARTDDFRAQAAPTEQDAAKFAARARAEDSERAIHRANKQQHWENLTYIGKMRERVRRFFRMSDPKANEKAQ